MNLVSNLQIGDKIGEGHFGEVFSGTDNVHGQVAVKILSLRDDETNAEWAVRKQGLLTEAQNLSHANHPNVVNVHYLVESSNKDAVHLCMELCANGSLQEPYERGPINLSRVKKIGTDVLFGLQALHAREMIHRDIKPSNILIDQNGAVKIGDFGLVTDDLMLGYGSIAGYADHVAYEMWHGTGSSTRSDIWAFGTTLYRLIHGKSWYDEHSPSFCTIGEGGFSKTLKWLPHVPKSWRRAIRRMLNDNTQKRYQSCDQLFNAISGLSVLPDWRCVTSKNKIEWESLKGSRSLKVEWIIHSQRKHEWRAWSQPLNGKGRIRQLGCSNGVVSQKAAISGLEDYFEA